MSVQEQSTSTPAVPGGGRIDSIRRRWLLLALVAAALLLLLFYDLTGGAHIALDALLTGGDWAAYAFCHRIAERSFTINGRPLPLCARCMGMYLGAALTVTALFLAGRTRRVLLPRKRLFLAMFGLLALMGLDGLNSYSHLFPHTPHLYEPRNWLRLVTGMGAGLTLGLITSAALSQALWRDAQYRPLLENWRELAGMLLLAAVAVALVLSNRAALLYVLAIVSTAGLLFVVTALNTAVLLVLLRGDARATTWKDALRPLAVGFLMTTLEIAAIGALRWSVTGTMDGFPGL